MNLLCPVMSKNLGKSSKILLYARSGPSLTAIPVDFDIFDPRFGFLVQKHMKYVTSNPNWALEDYFEYR